MNDLFKLSADYINDPIGYQEPIRIYKGVNGISFDVSEFHNENNPIVKLDIDFNDGSEFITKFYNFEYPNKIVEVISNFYHPDKDYQIIIYYPTIYMKFLNGKEFVYQCPIKVSKNSFYTEFLNIDIADAQFIDNSDNSLFVTLDTKIGDILNIKIK
jgi:hypothetical protein